MTSSIAPALPGAAGCSLISHLRVQQLLQICLHYGLFDGIKPLDGILTELLRGGYMGTQDEPGDPPTAKVDTEEEAGRQPTPPPRPDAPATREPSASQRSARLSRVHRIVKEIEPWGILVAVVALLLSLASFWMDYSGRVDERTMRAWQLLATRAPGSSGKAAALEYLNREYGLLCFEALQGRLWWMRRDQKSGCLIQLKAQVSLAGVDLSISPDDELQSPILSRRLTSTIGSYLRYVRLPGANLTGANLRNVDLAGADLSNAVLAAADLRGTALSPAAMRFPVLNLLLRQTSQREADFRWGVSPTDADLRGANLSPRVLQRSILRKAYLVAADLRGADLRDANLNVADLRGALLGGADFRGAHLSGANMGNAKLTDAFNLTREQLDHACGEENTELPEGLTIKQSEHPDLCLTKPSELDG